MRNFKLPAIALIIATAALLGCGGGSAGPAPPGTVPPAITAISPLVVDANTQVKFSATTTGSTITRWTWTFGNAASPSTARNASPSVTVGDPGTYDCRVVGENAWYETTTTFKLVIELLSSARASFRRSNPAGPGCPVSLRQDGRFHI